MTPEHEGIKEGTIILPDKGLEKNSVYLVDVAFTRNNIIHRAIMEVGSIPNNISKPADLSHPYNWLMGSYEDLADLGDVYYLRVVRKLVDGSDLYMHSYPEDYNYLEKPY